MAKIKNMLARRFGVDNAILILRIREELLNQLDPQFGSSHIKDKIIDAVCDKLQDENILDHDIAHYLINSMIAMNGVRLEQRRRKNTLQLRLSLPLIAQKAQD